MNTLPVLAGLDDLSWLLFCLGRWVAYRQPEPVYAFWWGDQVRVLLARARQENKS